MCLTTNWPKDSPILHRNIHTWASCRLKLKTDEKSNTLKEKETKWQSAFHTRREKNNSFTPNAGEQKGQRKQKQSERTRTPAKHQSVRID